MFQDLDRETILQQRHLGAKWQMLNVNIFGEFLQMCHTWMCHKVFYDLFSF